MLHEQEPRQTAYHPDSSTLKHRLSLSQLKAVQSSGPTIVDAPPGAGKTCIAVERVAHLIRDKGVDPYGILVVTFGVKAARELRTRLEAVLTYEQVKLISIKNFHRLGLGILRESGHLLGYPHDDRGHKPSIKPPEQCRAVIRHILSGKISAMGDAESEKHIALLSAHMTLDEVVRLISAFKADGITPEVLVARATDPNQKALGWCYATYQVQLKQAGAVDFDDLILQPLLLLESDAETRAYYQSRYAHVLVDEFQDTSLNQYRILRYIAEQHHNITVIGDPHQSIYGFRGAMGADGFELFRKDFLNANVVYLPDNFRSTPEIAKVAELFLMNARLIGSDRQQVATQPSGMPVFLFKASSDHQEAKWVVDELVNAVKAGFVTYDDCVVLVRTHAQVQWVEQQLLKVRVPYFVMGEGTFFDHPEIQVVRACLRLSLDFLGDPIALGDVFDAFHWMPLGLRTTLMGDEPVLLAEHIFDGERIRQLKPQEQQHVIHLQERLYVLNDHQVDTPEALITFVMKEEGLGYGKVLAARPDGATQIERVRALLRLARPFNTIGEFLDELDTMSGDDPLSLFAASRVTLSTIHAFKGLERKLVFLTGFEDGYFPSASSAASVDEDLRLAYVGFTRATQALCVSFAQTRDGYKRQSSAWLRGLPMEMRRRPDWVQAAAAQQSAMQVTPVSGNGQGPSPK